MKIEPLRLVEAGEFSHNKVKNEVKEWKMKEQ
jgi:hypothetical protein